MSQRFQILTLNQISSHGLHRFPSARYAVGKACEHPDAILVRSHDMHGMTIPGTVKAIGRAGAGTNNIPVAAMSERGVPVFNAPGANANAVKELVLAALLMAARNVGPALGYVAGLDAAAPDLEAKVEDGKKQFAGVELRIARSGSSASARSAAWSPTPRSAQDEGDRIRPEITVDAIAELHSGSGARTASRSPEASRLRHAARAAPRRHAQPPRREARRWQSGRRSA
jgi:hypothetical protein